MTGRTKEAPIRTRNARLIRTLKPRPEAYWRDIAPGRHLGYRKLAGNRDGSWIARDYRGGKQYRFKRLGCADDSRPADGTSILSYQQAEALARQWFAANDSAALNDEGLHAGPYTVADAIREYMADYRRRKGDRSTGTIESVANAHILPSFGKKEVGKLTSNNIRNWHMAIATEARKPTGRPSKHPREKLALTGKPTRPRMATANRVLTVLKSALNHAFREGRVDTDIAWRRVKPFQGVDAPLVRYLTTDEITRLVNACDPDFRPIVQAALFTGCRYGEICEMTVGDFDPRSRSVAIRHSKSGKPRHAILTQEGADFFQATAVGRKRDQPMFPRPDGTPRRKSEQRRPMLSACERAKINPPVGFHILRHTHGSLLALAGTPMRVIADQLGHADTRMTERHYAHLSPSYVAETIRANMPTLGIVEPSNVEAMRMRR